MNTVFVGIDPGRNGTDPLSPDYPTGSRLADLMGVDPGYFVRYFDRVNLHSSSDILTQVHGDQAAADNLRPILRGRRVIFLGQRVADAFRTPKDPLTLFQWRVHGEFVSAVVPHPSGLNRWWNAEENRIVARQFFESVPLPCVHVEGADGTGKTTLVSHLAELTSCTAVPTDDPPDSWSECLRRISRRIACGVVCDRSSGLVSELVYGPVLRGGTITAEQTVWEAVRTVCHAVTFVYCRPPDDAVKPTFRPGEDPVHVQGVKDRKADLLRRYDQVFEQMERIGCRVVRYDYTRQSAEEVARCVA